jgi:GTP-binding protein Era
VRSGFISIVGRPNVGKSTLLNQIIGTKVSIVSNKVQTTRTQIRAVLNHDDAQLVFVDTPGINKPRTLLGERLNESAYEAASGVDVVVMVIDARQPIGDGDRFVASRVPKNSILVVNKIDRTEPKQVFEQLAAASEFDFEEYFPVSARTGKGVEELVAALAKRMPEGPAFYPEEIISDTPEEAWVAELVREQLLAVLRDEVPHSVATRVTEWDWPHVRVEILVERESQKGIVIGNKGEVLKEVGIRARQQMQEGAFLELFVKVDKDWQRNPRSLENLGY